MICLPRASPLVLHAPTVVRYEHQTGKIEHLDKCLCFPCEWLIVQHNVYINPQAELFCTHAAGYHAVMIAACQYSN